jgi:hypothetical protein
MCLLMGAVLLSTLFLFLLGALNFDNFIVAFITSLVCSGIAAILFLWRDRTIWTWAAGILSLTVAAFAATILLGAFGIGAHWTGGHP